MISVIVCTANRGERLDACLDALARAGENGPRDWELIVVDNGSVDDTRAVIERRAARGDLPIQYVFEPRRGLSRARNAGVVAASRAIVAFTDDDCLVEAGWLDAIESAFADSRLSILGGRVTLHDPADLAVSIRPFTDPVDVVDPSDILHYLIGCNMMVRRSVFSVVGPFDVRLGAGTPARSAEDLDFIYRGLKRGLIVRYSPAPHVLHAHGRRSAATEAELSRGYLAGRGAFYAKHVLRGDWNALKQLRWEIRGLGTSPKADSRRQALKALLSGGIGYILGR